MSLPSCSGASTRWGLSPKIFHNDLTLMALAPLESGDWSGVGEGTSECSRLEPASSLRAIGASFKVGFIAFRLSGIAPGCRLCRFYCWKAGQ